MEEVFRLIITTIWIVAGIYLGYQLGQQKIIKDIMKQNLDEFNKDVKEWRKQNRKG